MGLMRFFRQARLVHKAPQRHGNKPARNRRSAKRAQQTLPRLASWNVMEEPEAHGQIRVHAFGTSTPARCILACIAYRAAGNGCDALAFETAGHERQCAALDKRRNDIAWRESNTCRCTNQLLASINSMIIPGHVR